MADLWAWLEHDISLSTLGTAAMGGVTTWLALRRGRREDLDSTTKRVGELLDQQRAELDRASRTLAAYASELDTLRTARYALEDIIIELRDHAVAARAMVHEYERRLDVPQTLFPPLPRPGLAGPARAPPGAV